MGDIVEGAGNILSGIWSAIANFFQWLFIPDANWLQSEIEAVSALAKDKLGIFYWLYDTFRRFLECFNNLQDYQGFKFTMPNGTETYLLQGEMWDSMVRIINPIATGLFAISFIVFALHKVSTMFDR